MAGELMGPRGETTMLIQLRGHSDKLASMILPPQPVINAAYRLTREISLRI